MGNHRGDVRLMMRMTFRSCKVRLEFRNQDSWWTRVMFWGLTEKNWVSAGSFPANIFNRERKANKRGRGNKWGTALSRKFIKGNPPYLLESIIQQRNSFILHVQLSIHIKSVEQKPTRDECVFQSSDCNIEQLKLKLNTVKTFTCHFTRLLFFACFPQYGQGKMSFWSFQNLNKWTKSHVLPHGTLINKLEQNLYFQLLARRWKLKHCKNCEICPSQVFWKKKFHVNCGRYECRYKAFRAAKNAKLTNISNTKLGTVDLRTRKETESRAECLEFVESFNKTLNNPK